MPWRLIQLRWRIWGFHFSFHPGMSHICLWMLCLSCRTALYKQICKALVGWLHWVQAVCMKGSCLQSHRFAPPAIIFQKYWASKIEQSRGKLPWIDELSRSRTSSFSASGWASSLSKTVHLLCTRWVRLWLSWSGALCWRGRRKRSIGLMLCCNLRSRN